MTSAGSKSRIKFEGDSLNEIRSWPKDVRADLGLELDRLDRGEEALNSEAVGKSAPGIHKLNEQDKDSWFRVLYGFHGGSIYVLHGFKKKTNKITNDDLQKAKERFSGVKARVAHNEKTRKKGKDKKHA